MKLRDEKGSTVVESAVIFTVFLLMLFGITDFGLALYRQEVLTNATREGARAGIVSASPPVGTGQIQAVVTNYLTAAGWNAGLANVTVAGAGGVFGSNLTVIATYPTSFIVLSALVPGLPATKTLTAQTVMKHE